MSTRAFRLAAVLRVRRLQEDLAAAALGAAAAEVEAARARLVDEQESLRVAAAAGAGQAAAGFAAHRTGLLVGADRVRDRGVELVERRAAAEVGRTELAGCRSRVTGLETLEGAHRERVTAGDLAVEQAAGDEVAIARWLRRPA